MGLADKPCIPCSGDVPPLERAEAEALLRELGRDWTIDGSGHLRKAYRFDDFAGAMGFADQLAIVAELEGHHPDLHIAWGRCTVEIWTHAIDGLSESDFVLAAKADRVWDRVDRADG